MRHLPFTVMVALFLVGVGGGQARAGWIRASGGSGNIYLTAVSSPGGQQVLAAGFILDTSNWLRPFTNKVLFSSDGGISMIDISGNLDDAAAQFTLAEIYFSGPQQGCVAGGTSILCTSDGGLHYHQVEVGFPVWALHLFDADSGMAVGEGGAIRRTEDGGTSWVPVASATTTDLYYQFWLDRNRGWACGYNGRVEEDPYGDEPDRTYFEDGIVISTTDGGETWHQGATFTTGGVGPMFFLDDGRTGWLARWHREDPTLPDDLASLLITTDGGLTYQDLGLPTQVGTLSSGFGTDPIDSSRILAMTWDDDARGHLAGIAFIAEVERGSSSGGTSTTTRESILRIVDYTTVDGGEHWQKTNLGTLQVQLGIPPVFPDSDGLLMDGVLADYHSGYLVADRSTVWGYVSFCSQSEQCGPGYRCTTAGVCQQESESPTEPLEPSYPDEGTPDATDSGRDRSPWPDGQTDTSGSGSPGQDRDTVGCGCSLVADRTAADGERHCNPKWTPWHGIFLWIALLPWLGRSRRRATRL